jgi:hypothetical protein
MVINTEGAINPYRQAFRVVKTTSNDWRPLVTVITDKTYEELKAEQEWDYEDKPLRIVLSDSDIVQLFKDIPPFRDYIDSMSDTTVARNGNQYIYLDEVYPQHEQLLANYSSFMKENRF